MNSQTTHSSTHPSTNQTHSTKLSTETKQKLKSVACGVRSLAMDAVLKSNSGHIGGPLGCADIGTYIYFYAMSHNPQNPTQKNRDRFVLSNGHCSALQYSLLHLAGYPVTTKDLANFRQLHSNTPGHPEFGETVGVEVTTGPLGQGIANSVGMALSAHMEAARGFIDKPYKIFTLVGDGCLMEGVSYEACSLAGLWKLDNLVVFYDSNNVTIDGNCDISFTEDVATRFISQGWQVFHADGHCFQSIHHAYQSSQATSPETSGKPTLIICTTTVAKTSVAWEGKPKAHGNPLNATDVIEAKKYMGLQSTEPFVLDAVIYTDAGALLGAKPTPSLQPQNSADPRFAAQSVDWAAIESQLPTKKWASRQMNHYILKAVASQNNCLVGGAADLAGSVLTDLGVGYVTPTNFAGSNIHFGVREHGMAAVANGLALSGVFKPFVGTFLSFVDYMRPTLRLASLMKIPTVFVFTHDSVYVGEDGPTHQPIEQLTSMRIIPGLRVFRPGSVLETMAVWQCIAGLTTPAVVVGSRQELEPVPHTHDGKAVLEGATQGFYTAFGEAKAGGVTILASGSELSLAFACQKAMAEKTPNLPVHIVSLVGIDSTNRSACKAWVRSLPTKKVFLEAGSTAFLETLADDTSLCLGIDRFGYSAPGNLAIEECGFSLVAVLEKIEAYLAN
jgi:transketolase